MSEAIATTRTGFVLPSSVVTKVDFSRILREIEQVDNDLNAARIRSKDGDQVHAPTVSGPLEDFLVQNKLQLSNSQQFAELIKQMRLIKDKAPVIHLTFAVTADRESLQQIADWLRSEVHPQALVSVGLQPALVAGVYMRTPNHVHDLSLRAALTKQHDSLVKDLEALRGAN